MKDDAVLTPYAAARARFLALASEQGARCESIAHPSARGPDAEVLAVDFAWIGAERPKRVFVAFSGMHGLEGPAGSAVQAAWFARLPKPLPPDAGICLVHALNPWGFAYAARATENNVDLNRNFMGFDGPLPQNPYYRHVRAAVRQPSLSASDLPRLMKTYEELMRDLGPARLSIAVNSGQYEDPEGLAFGGLREEFGHRALTAGLVRRLAAAERVRFIDWHTGVGAYGEVAFLPSGHEGSAAFAACEAMWGAKRVREWRRSQTEESIAADEALIGESTGKTGQLRHWLAETLPQADVAGAVIELGTERAEDAQTLILCTLYDRWLRFVSRTARTHPEHAPMLAAHRRLFVPDDRDWRAVLMREGPLLMDQALAAVLEP